MWTFRDLSVRVTDQAVVLKRLDRKIQTFSSCTLNQSNCIFRVGLVVRLFELRLQICIGGKEIRSGADEGAFGNCFAVMLFLGYIINPRYRPQNHTVNRLSVILSPVISRDNRSFLQPTSQPAAQTLALSWMSAQPRTCIKSSQWLQICRRTNASKFQL